MKHVYARIRARLDEYKRAPFYEFLRDPAIRPGDKLVFAPCIGHFVMTFTDLNKLIYRDLSFDDEYQQIVNRHSYEDEDHWMWLLDDLRKLGWDDKITGITESMRFLWSDCMIETRMLMYRVVARALGAHPLIKLSIIEVFEDCGNVFLSRINPVARELCREREFELDFFGRLHLDNELGHVANEGELSRRLQEIELTEELRRSALEAVEDTFDGLIAFMDELWSYSQMALGTRDNAESIAADPGRAGTEPRAAW
ncbi:MAG: hypothetical protein MJE77_43540 [Proteobacteria bacterium]|nr:hypothetical protein [Pseudomonadota bacterium]